MRALTLIFAMMASLAACAETDAPASNFVEGKHYKVIETPARTADPSKIEVVEAFWYGCSHCRTFDPSMQAWAEKQAGDVNVVYLPAMWNKSMEAHARIFYAAQNLNIESKLRKPMFDTLKEEYRKKNRAALTDIDDITAFVKTHTGVEADVFTKQYNSFGVTSQVKKAASNARSYKITGTPEMVVDGKYVVSASLAGSQSNMLKVVDQLVAKIRKEKG